jgi:hypothetical protein
MGGTTEGKSILNNAGALCNGPNNKKSSCIRKNSAAAGELNCCKSSYDRGRS